MQCSVIQILYYDKYPTPLFSKADSFSSKSFFLFYLHWILDKGCETWVTVLAFPAWQHSNILRDRTRPAIKLWVYGRNSFHSKTFTNFVLEIDLDLFTLWGTWSRASVVIQNMIMLIQSAIASFFLLEMRCISMHWLFPKKSTRLKIGKTKLTCILY